MSPPLEAVAQGPRRWLGLVFVGLGVALIIVDSTIVNVAIPPIIRDIGLTSTEAQWVQEVYTLVFASLLLVWGRLADRYGRRLLFLLGTGIFAAASVLAALSQSGPELIGSRVAQGVGGAMMLPTSLSLLNAGFRGRDRGIAFAVWGSTIGAAGALGPLLGGWLTTAFSWRWAFGVNIPFGLAVLLGALAFVAESRDEGASGGNDLLGASLSVLGCGGIVFGLIEGRQYGWLRLARPLSISGVSWPQQVSPIPVAFAVGVVALALFVVAELRRSRQGKVVLLDLRLFRIPSFRNGNLAAAIVSLGEFGLLFSLPLWFENVRGYTAFQTGLALLPLAIGSVVSSGLAVQLGARRGAAFVVRLGIALEALAVIGIGIVIGPTTPWWETTPPLFVYGMGVGLATAQLTGVALVDVPVESSGQGSGIQSTTRQVGSAFGVAVLGSVLFGVLTRQLSGTLAQHLPLPAGQREAIVEAVQQSAGAVIAGLAHNPHTALVAEYARDAFSEATRWTAFCAAAFLILGLLASLSLSRGSALRSKEGEGKLGRVAPDRGRGPGSA
ncbi:MAG TPA: DHA2 family efflux MFS transporter permease subunit [Candidatus Dormibacteraeota bacterium]|nr:DHA2 family efflux MFS transporter permease subunit [Candidatus Dormibacteraeota bacterium]